MAPFLLKEVFTIRERILAAFLDLSKTKGFYRVTMDELAAEAGISKRTLYRYFRSKDEIIETTLDNFMGEVAEKIDEFVSVHHKPDQAFTHIVDILYHAGRIIRNPLVLDDLRQYYPHYWKKIDNFRMEKAQKMIKSKIFLDEKNKEYIRKIDPRIVTTAILASVQAVVNPQFIITNGLTFEETVRQLMEFFQYGIIEKEGK